MTILVGAKAIGVASMVAAASIVFSVVLRLIMVFPPCWPAPRLRWLWSCCSSLPHTIERSLRNDEGKQQPASRHALKVRGDVEKQHEVHQAANKQQAEKRTTPCRLPVDLSLPDDVLWSSLEEQARKLPGFRPRTAWAADVEKQIAEATKNRRTAKSAVPA